MPLPSRVSAWRIAGQASTLLGLALIVALWAMLYTTSSMQARIEQQEASLDLQNMARLFERNSSEVLSQIDRVAQFLRDGIEEDGGVANFARHVARARILSNLTVQIAVADARGDIIASNMGLPQGPPINISDREHFHVHVSSSTDRLFISPPVFGRVSSKWTVQLSRRVRSRDGGFNGALIVSLSPEMLARASSGINLDRRYRVDIVGLDGIVRASAGTAPLPMAKAINETELAQRMKVSEGDAFIARESPDGPLRLIAFQRLEDYPLAVAASINLAHTNSGVSHTILARLWPTAILTFVIVAALLYNGRRYISAERLRAAALLAAEQATARNANQLSLTLANMDQGIIMVDADRRIAVINSRAAKLLDLPSNHAEIGAGFDAAVDFLHSMQAFGSDATAQDHEQRFRAAQRDQISTCYDTVGPGGSILEIRTELLDDGGFVRTISDVTSRRTAEAKVRHLAHHDTLTGLANRMTFREHLSATARSATQDAPVAAYVLDLDRFKLVNDTLGHPVGDRLLKLVAERLRHCVRSDDLVSRLSGDEFAIIQHLGVTADGCEALARRILKTVAAPYLIDGREVCIGVSVGIATAPEHGAEPDDLLAAADLALYRAKREGRGQFRIFTPEISAEVVERRQIEDDLRGAVDRGEFELHYQPIVNTDGGKPSSFEALIRWNHPTRGLVQPNRFIAIAEEIGVLVEMGGWALMQACRDASQWREDWPVAVNLSPVQLKTGDFAALVATALETSGLKPERLVLEITESTLLEQDEANIALLRDLRAMGVRIALDDFGQGYASLGYLLKFPFDLVKIDRNFVARLGDDGAEDSTALVRAMLDVATALNIRAVAEGVETELQLRTLRGLGCRLAQGFLFGQPVPVRDLNLGATEEAEAA